jgi:uncharacterized membrane protein YgcG
MAYRCISPFISSANNCAYKMGQKIFSSEYNQLKYSERSNFTDEDEETYSSNSSTDNTISSLLDFSLWNDTGSSSSGLDLGSNDSSSFDGFGGGDTGGGGASGDW